MTKLCFSYYKIRVITICVSLLASEMDGEKPLRITKELKKIGQEAIVLPGASVRAISAAISDAVNKTEANDTTRYPISKRS